MKDRTIKDAPKSGKISRSKARKAAKYVSKDKVKKHEKKEDTIYRKLQRENKKFEREVK